ncbi:MAG: hypothetical protein IPL79_08145 [Myxococcales bacterium]|nr:hypothetical protein [Myxococcales bacterium]
MNPQAVSALLAALLILAIGVTVWLRNRRDRTNGWFAAFSLTLAAWQLCTALAATSSDPLWHWLVLWPAAAIPPMAIGFFSAFLAQPSIGATYRRPQLTLIATALVLLALIYSQVGVHLHDQLWFQIPFAVYVYGALYLCVGMLFQQYRRSTRQAERARLRYLTLGGFITTTFALSDVLPRLGVGWPTVGNVLAVLYLYFLAQTMFRSRLIDLNELLGKMAVLGILVVLLSIVYGVLLAWVGSGQEGLFLLNALTASFVILIVFEPIRSSLEANVARWLLRQRKPLRTFLDFRRGDWIATSDLPTLAGRLMDALEESGRFTDAYLYLIAPDGNSFECIASIGEAASPTLDAGRLRELTDRLKVGVINTEPAPRYARRGATDERGSKAAELVLGELGATIAVGFVGYPDPGADVEPIVFGFLAGRDARAVAAFDEDDIAALQGLARQAARVLEASRAFEQLKARERLAALGAMAAGLAHEIRNPLGAIKGATQLLMSQPDLRLGGESQEFLGVIVEEVNRLNNVVTRFLDYARVDHSNAATHQYVALNAVVKKTAQLLAQAEEHRNCAIDVELDEILSFVDGDAEALVQVFLNLGLNALQAMPQGGTLTISTHRRNRSRQGFGRFCEVRFVDTGAGIPKERMDNLFIPFFTTKQTGSGLGLAIAQRIVSQHGGTIEVSSNVGRGATFSVLLPAGQTQAEAATSPERRAETP